MEPAKDVPPGTVSILRGRFELRRRIGSGASGTVYDAIDRTTRARVAVKRFSSLLPEHLTLFKNEFRAVADLAHPNLVQLLELFADGEECFFTMELVPGSDFASYTRATWPDAARTRKALRQLALGLEALHARDKIHRDIKPSNVLVREDGTLKILDFGIMQDRRARALVTEIASVAGTPAYMAPEQATEEAHLTPAADLYAVGTMLYEVLAGRLPFPGKGLAQLNEKLTRPPEPLPDGLPGDLAAMCMRMLDADPRARPTAQEIASWLGGVPEHARSRRDVSSAGIEERPAHGAHEEATSTLVGRAKETAALEDALRSALAGDPTTVLLEGTSGLGKTALVESFLERAATRNGALVLRSRCYERETMPYKAFDGIMEHLSRLVRQMPDDERTRVTPRHAGALTRVFPVLARVPSFARAEAALLLDVSPHRLREQAFAAWRELLARLADRSPVVLFIDDLQWGDADSAVLLQELVASGDDPRLLVVLSYRVEEKTAHAWLAALTDERTGLVRNMRLAMLRVGPLDDDAAAELVRRDAGAQGADPNGAVVARIVAEAGGSPFFLHELVRYWVDVEGARDGAGAPRELSLATVLRERIAALPADSGRLLGLLAVAGRPWPERLLLDGAGLDSAEGAAALAALRAAAMVRASAMESGSSWECAHDRIREAAVQAIADDARREMHRRLASGMAERGEDPEAAFVHFQAAGMAEETIEYALRAATRATSALAFDRAADFQRTALELLAEGDARAAVLRLRLADSLANAGRGSDAAAYYLDAAKRASGVERMALERRAAEELLFCGHVDQGTDALARILAHYGVRLHLSRLRALVALLVLRLWLRVRGLSFREIAVEKLPAEALARTDVLIAASAGLSTVDNIVAASFSVRSLLACLTLGEPWRVSRLLCLELQLQATAGEPARARIDELLTTARQLAQRVARADSSALLVGATGMVHLFRGEWGEAQEKLAKADELYREREATSAAGIHALGGANFSARWEHSTFRFFGTVALAQLGRLSELRGQMDTHLRDARRRGDLYLYTNLVLAEPGLRWLAEDRPDEAANLIEDALQGWSKRGFKNQHWYAFNSLSMIDLYRGQVSDAVARVEHDWPRLQGSMLMRLQYIRVRAWHARGRVDLAWAESRSGAEKSAALARAREASARMLKERVAWATGLGSALAAGVAVASGDRLAARAPLEAAVRAFEATRMGLWAAVAQHRLAGLDGSTKATEEQLVAAGVKRPERLARAMMPGWGAAE